MRNEQYETHAALGLQHWWHYGTKMFFLHLARQFVPRGSSVLDAGCGVGDMLGLLKEDYDVHGVDASEVALDYCRSKGLHQIIRQGSVESLPFADESFDAAFSLDVLYHQWVSDEVRAVKELYRILKPGGVVFVQVPAYEWLRGGHDVAAMTARRYTAPRLASLLSAAGFTATRIAYRMTLLFPLAALRRLMSPGTDSDMKRDIPLMNALLRQLMRLENCLVLRVNLPLGLSVFAVARK